jgi:hypothetical protein
MANEWGPLAALAGEWQGEGGLDTAFSHSRGEVLGTPSLEKVTLKPFGPVDNGSQHLYGLDYKSAMVPYSIGENIYLAKNASTLSYEVTITVGADTLSYDETTMLRIYEFAEPFAHTDRNTLHRVA